VPIKTPEQQGLQGLHRIREHHKSQRTAAINLMRGLLREFGVVMALGAAKVRPAVLAALEDGDNELPMALRHALAGLLDEVASHEAAMSAIENALREFAQRDARSQRLQQAGGVGLITATAMSASIGDFDRFPSGRHFASALGLTPRECSSGNTRRLGRITKRGDTYLRMLLIHGARAALRAAIVARNKARRSTRPKPGHWPWPSAVVTTRQRSHSPTRWHVVYGPPSITARTSIPITSARDRSRPPPTDPYPRFTRPVLHPASLSWQSVSVPGTNKPITL
jgi:transposase